MIRLLSLDVEDFFYFRDITLKRTFVCGNIEFCPIEMKNTIFALFNSHMSMVFFFGEIYAALEFNA